MEQCQVSFGGIISRRVDHNTCETPRPCNARHASIMLRHSRYQRFRHQQKSFPQKAGEKRQENSTPELEEHQNGIRTAG
jgi:hypothetical protein